jgi:hypothetical protein
MKQTSRALAFVLALLPAIAAAQTFPTVPSQTVIGRTAFGTGPAQAIPFSSITANLCNTFTLTLKGCVPPPTTTTGRYLSDDIAAPWKAVPSQQVVAGTGVSLGGTCVGSSLNCTVTATSAVQYTFQSRAIAAGLDLSLLSAVRTLGYALPGDGGGAVFKKVSGSTAFIDSFISTFSIQGGTGCTNGTYGAPSGSISTTAIIWNKSGNPTLAVGSGTVAGGVVTAVNITGTPGNAYSVGDVLTAQNPLTGCSVQPTITVTAVTAPQASFIDAAGNRWQYVPDTAAFPNVLQFGCKGDWNGVDASATDNFTCVRAAANFAAFRSSTSFDSGGYWGGRVIVPSGSYMMCGSTATIAPEGTVIAGASEPGTSQFHLCDAFNPNLNAFTICDPVWGFACLGAHYENIAFHASRSVAVGGGIFMIYSNNLQDFGGLYKVYVYGGQRGCFHFEKGYGGSSWVGAEKVSCNIGSPNNPMVRIGNTVASGMNFGSTIVSLKDIVLGGPSSSPFQLQSGMQVYGGHANIENVHCEVINGECIYLDSPAGGNPIQMSFKNINSQGCASGGTCNGVITLAGTNDPGNVVLSQIIATGAPYTHVINNGQPAGTSYNLGIKSPMICTTTCHTEVIP